MASWAAICEDRVYPLQHMEDWGRRWVTPFVVKLQNDCYAQVGERGPNFVSEKVHLGAGQTGGDGTLGTEVARLLRRVQLTPDFGEQSETGKVKEMEREGKLPNRGHLEIVPGIPAGEVRNMRGRRLVGSRNAGMFWLIGLASCPHSYHRI